MPKPLLGFPRGESPAQCDESQLNVKVIFVNLELPAKGSSGAGTSGSGNQLSLELSPGILSPLTHR